MLFRSVGGDSALHSLRVAGAVASDDAVELVPVDLAVVVGAALGVPLQIRVGDGQADEFCLWDRGVDETLALQILRRTDAIQAP